MHPTMMKWMSSLNEVDWKNSEEQSKPKKTRSWICFCCCFNIFQSLEFLKVSFGCLWQSSLGLLLGLIYAANSLIVFYTVRVLESEFWRVNSPEFSEEGVSSLVLLHWGGDHGLGSSQGQGLHQMKFIFWEKNDSWMKMQAILRS